MDRYPASWCIKAMPPGKRCKYFMLPDGSTDFTEAIAWVKKKYPAAEEAWRG
jgi:hypothetical protein